MNIYHLSQLIILFFVFAFLGWVMEVIIVLHRQHHFVNRGFLRGPFCPIYGVGVVTLTFLDYYLLKKKRKFLETFLLGFIVCGALEYAVSWLLEKIYHARWWDYTSKRFNLHGRICLDNLILFGIGTVLLLHFMVPSFFHCISQISPLLIVVVSLLLLIILGIDIVFTHIYTFKVKDLINPHLKDHTEEINRQIKQLLKH